MLSGASALCRHLIHKGRVRPPPALRPRVVQRALPPFGRSEAGPARLWAPTRVVRNSMRLSPRRPIGVLGVWYRGPGASRAASQGRWATATIRAIPGTVRLSRPPYAWQPSPLERPASDAPCVFSGLTSELAHYPRYFRPEGQRPAPHPTSPAPTTRHDLASVRRTRRRIAQVESAGISWQVALRIVLFYRLSSLRKQRPTSPLAQASSWVPAFAGMTRRG